MVVAFLEGALNLGIFTRALLRHPKFQAEFFENLISPNSREGEIRFDFDLLYQNSTRKYEDNLEH